MTTALAPHTPGKLNLPALPPNAPECVVQVRDRMQHMIAILPRDVDAERFASVTIMALMRTPMLHKCDPATIVDSAYKIARLGLELGLTAHILPFGAQAQLIIEYNGMMQLARPYVRSVHTCIVYANERFLLGPGKVVLEHEPILEESQQGKPIAAYCLIETLNGGQEYTVMGLDAIERIKRDVLARKRSGKPSPWETHWGAMAEKTVLRRALKRIPMPPGIMQALRDEERFDLDRSERPKPQTITIDEPIEAEFEGDARE